MEAVEAVNMVDLLLPLVDRVEVEVIIQSLQEQRPLQDRAIMEEQVPHLAHNLVVEVVEQVQQGAMLRVLRQVMEEQVLAVR